MGSIGPSKKTSGSPDVLIIGAGLAGLTAALECHRKGMSVRVLERSPTLNTAGMSTPQGLALYAMKGPNQRTGK